GLVVPSLDVAECFAAALLSGSSAVRVTDLSVLVGSWRCGARFVGCAGFVSVFAFAFTAVRVADGFACSAVVCCGTVATGCTVGFVETTSSMPSIPSAGLVTLPTVSRSPPVTVLTVSETVFTVCRTVLVTVSVVVFTVSTAALVRFDVVSEASDDATQQTGPLALARFLLILRGLGGGFGRGVRRLRFGGLRALRGARLLCGGRGGADGQHQQPAGSGNTHGDRGARDQTKRAHGDFTRATSARHRGPRSHVHVHECCILHPFDPVPDVPFGWFVR